MTYLFMVTAVPFMLVGIAQNPYSFDTGIVDADLDASELLAVDAFSVEFTVHNDLSLKRGVIDAYAVAFTVFNQLSRSQISEAFSSQFTVHNNLTHPTSAEAFAIELTVHNDLASIPPDRDACARQFTVAVCMPGDCNCDQRVDLEDFSGFAACMQGPQEKVEPQCQCYDFDRNDTVDMKDFATFQRVFGPSG